MALARALAPEPKVLLLDEPFGALDARVRAELREWLRRLHDEVHVTTVFVTHDQLEAMEVADQIAVLNEGRVEQVGSPRELYDEPASEFVMRFVGEANRWRRAARAPARPRGAARAGGGAVEAQVERVTMLGFEARLELAAADGEHVAVQLTRRQLEELELVRGDIVWLRASGERAFA